LATRCVFGPVPSRRLGLSLGVDPLPFKTCNWNCVYCQLGHSTTLVTARRDWIPVSDILRETEQALDRFGQLARAGSEEIDWITIAGSGEPTLVAGLGELIRGVRSLTDTPLAVITNGSLLFLPEVRADLAPADAVMPTLDAGNEALYRRIYGVALSDIAVEAVIKDLARGDTTDRVNDGLAAVPETQAEGWQAVSPKAPYVQFQMLIRVNGRLDERQLGALAAMYCQARESLAAQVESAGSSSPSESQD